MAGQEEQEEVLEQRGGEGEVGLEGNQIDN